MRTGITNSLRSRLWLTALGAGIALQAGAAKASETFAVFSKNGSELHVNLGNHDTFTSAQVNLATLPAAFGGSLVGATVTVVGEFDENAKLGDFDRPNILFSASDDPNVLTDDAIGAASDQIYGGVEGFSDFARSIPLGGQRNVGSTENNSLQVKVGTNVGGINILLPLKRHGRVTPVPVFGAAAGITGPPEFNVAFPLKFSEDGKIAKFTSADLPVKTQAFAVFSKGGSDLIVNLGDHDALASSPVDIGSKLSTTPGFAGTLDGATFALLGVFDEDFAGRSNLMFSSPTPPVPPVLSAGQIDSEFALVVDFFLTNLASIPQRNTLTIPSADATSFSTKFGCTGLGAFPSSICGSVGPSGLSIPITGAATNPHEVAQIQQLNVTPAGIISTVPTL